MTYEANHFQQHKLHNKHRDHDRHRSKEENNSLSHCKQFHPTSEETLTLAHLRTSTSRPFLEFYTKSTLTTPTTALSPLQNRHTHNATPLQPQTHTHRVVTSGFVDDNRGDG